MPRDLGHPMGALPKRTASPWGTSTTSSSLLTSKAYGQRPKYGFFNQLHLIPLEHDELELSHTRGPREHGFELTTPVHDGNPAALRLSESCSRIRLSPAGHFPVTRVLAEAVTICSFCPLAARLHPGSSPHQEPGNSLFTSGCASSQVLLCSATSEGFFGFFCQKNLPHPYIEWDTLRS